MKRPTKGLIGISFETHLVATFPDGKVRHFPLSKAKANELGEFFQFLQDFAPAFDCDAKFELVDVIVVSVIAIG